MVRKLVGLSVAAFGSLVLMGTLITPTGKTLPLLLVAAFLIFVGYRYGRQAKSWRDDPPTERQLSYAADLGIAVPPGATKGEVSAMITAVTGR